jgi:hypothetical protein
VRRLSRSEGGALSGEDFLEGGFPFLREERGVDLDRRGDCEERLGWATWFLGWELERGESWVCW